MLNEKKFLDLSSYDRWPLWSIFIILLLPYDIFTYVTNDFIPYNQYSDLIANVALIWFAIYFDAKYINESKLFTAPPVSMMLLVPLYLWKRDTYTKKNNRNIFWIGMFCLTLNILFIPGINEAQYVATDICDVLDDIDSLKDKNIKCVKAYNLKEEYKGYWEGIARLSNDKKVKVTADYNKEVDSVYVTYQSYIDL